MVFFYISGQEVSLYTPCFIHSGLISEQTLYMQSYDLGMKAHNKIYLLFYIFGPLIELDPVYSIWCNQIFSFSP